MTPIPYGRQEITEQDKAAVLRVLEGGWLSGGPEIEAFEAEFARYIGAPYAVAVANGSVALHLCAMALEVVTGQTWITSPITFAATAHAIRLCGGEIRLVDVDPATGLIDLDLVEELLEASPAGTFAGILPVHYAGHPVDMPRLHGLAGKHGLRIIEDACHAPGGEGPGFRCGDGRFADLAIFSFHPVKHLTTGEGGMITTADSRLAERLRNLRTHGIERRFDHLPEGSPPWYYEIHELGLNGRLSALQAALGRSQLTMAGPWLQRRKDLARRYHDALAGSTYGLPPMNEGHAWHLFVIRHPQREALFHFLRSRQIFPQVHYVPLHHHPGYAETARQSGPLPCADAFYASCLSIPLFHGMTDEEQDRVLAALSDFEQGQA